ncbi:3023_t:CDS:1, partial [Ambispora gerdemannii]
RLKQNLPVVATSNASVVRQVMIMLCQHNIFFHSEHFIKSPNENIPLKDFNDSLICRAAKMINKTKKSIIYAGRGILASADGRKD